jgi:hypothetical protein
VESGERAALDADRLTDVDDGPGLRGEAGGDDGLDSGDLIFGDGCRYVCKADDGRDARGAKDREAELIIEAAEYVSWEKRKLHGLNPIRPAAASTIEREKIFESSIAK